ncbi:hypothetical protein DOY81_012877 [Sarcophaga bullata]|nr:hypothetical protein DOY81_012877 [Sarcophaga bullata]
MIAEIVAGGLAAFYKETARNESKTFLQPPSANTIQRLTYRCCYTHILYVKNIIPEDDSCVTNPTEGNSFFMKGCYDVFAEWIISHREVIIAVLFGVGLIHLLAIFLAFCLCKSFAKYHGMRL